MKPQNTQCSCFGALCPIAQTWNHETLHANVNVLTLKPKFRVVWYIWRRLKPHSHVFFVSWYLVRRPWTIKHFLTLCYLLRWHGTIKQSMRTFSVPTAQAWNHKTLNAYVFVPTAQASNNKYPNAQVLGAYFPRMKPCIEQKNVHNFGTYCAGMEPLNTPSAYFWYLGTYYAGFEP